MRLPAGCTHYQEHTVIVKNKRTGRHGVVTRVCPKGNHIPACAHVMYGSDEEGWDERWEPLRDLTR